MINPRIYKFLDKKIKIAAFAAIIFALFAVGCGANESILKSGTETPSVSNVESTKTTFEKDIEQVRAADFTFVYVLRRRDGGKIDAEDRSVIKLQTADANRRVAADDDRAIIIGSNYQLPAKNMRVLYERFAVDNYSPPPKTDQPNSNVNQ